MVWGHYPCRTWAKTLSLTRKMLCRELVVRVALVFAFLHDNNPSIIFQKYKDRFCQEKMDLAEGKWNEIFSELI